MELLRKLIEHYPDCDACGEPVYVDNPGEGGQHTLCSLPDKPIKPGTTVQVIFEPWEDA